MIFLQTAARLILGPILAAALALWAKGYAGVGGGFVAGVVAATGIGLFYVIFDFRTVARLLPIRLAPVAAGMGMGLLLAATFLPTLAGYPLLTHFPRPSSELTKLGALELHTSVLFDAGEALVVVGAVIGILEWLATTAERNQR